MKQCWLWLSVLPAVQGIITSFLTDISTHERRQIQVHLSDSRLQFVFPDRSRKPVNIRLSNLIITPSEATTYLIVQDQQEGQLHFNLESDSWLKSAIIQRKIKDTMRRRIEDGEAYEGMSPLDFLRSQIMEDDEEGSMTDRKKFSFLAKDESLSPSASPNASSGEPAEESHAKPALKNIISTASSARGSYEVINRREGLGLSTIESKEAASDSISTHTDNDVFAELEKDKKKKAAEGVKIGVSVSSNVSDVIIPNNDHKPGESQFDQPSAEHSEKAKQNISQDPVQVEAKSSPRKQESTASSGSIHGEEARPPSEINGERADPDHIDSGSSKPEILCQTSKKLAEPSQHHLDRDKKKIDDLPKPSSSQACEGPQVHPEEKSSMLEGKANESPEEPKPHPSIVSIESKPQNLESEQLNRENQEKAQTEAHEVLKEILTTKVNFDKPNVIPQPSLVESQPQKPDFPEPKDEEGLQQGLGPTGVHKSQSMKAAQLSQVPDLVAHESSLVNFESLSIAHALPDDLLKEDEPENPDTKGVGMTNGPKILEPEVKSEPEQPTSNAPEAKVPEPKSHAAKEKIQEAKAKPETPIVITLTKIPNLEAQQKLATPRQKVQRPEVIVIPTIEVQPEGEPQPELEKKAEDKPLRLVIFEPKDQEELPEPEIADIKPVESHGKIKEIRFEGNPAPPKLTDFAMDDADLGADGSVTLRQGEGIFAAGQWAHIRASCLLRETAVSHPRGQGNGGFKMYHWKSNDPAELPIVPNPSRALYHCLGTDDPKLDHFPSILLASHNFVEGPSPNPKQDVAGWNKNRSGLILKKDATFSQLADWLKDTLKWTKDEAYIDLFSRTQYGWDSKVQTNVILHQVYYDFNAEPNANLKGRLADLYTELYTQVILMAISRHETGLDYIFLSTGQASLPDVLAGAALRAASSLSAHLGGIKVVLVTKQ